MYNVKNYYLYVNKFNTFFHNSKKVNKMNRRITKEFTFQYPLSHKVVRNCRLVTEQVGNLSVEGIGYFNPSSSPFDAEDSRYNVDIDFIKWNGTDIKPVLEVSGMIEEVTDATIRYIATLFEGDYTKELAA